MYCDTNCRFRVLQVSTAYKMESPLKKQRVSSSHVESQYRMESPLKKQRTASSHDESQYQQGSPAPSLVSTLLDSPCPTILDSPCPAAQGSDKSGFASNVENEVPYMEYLDRGIPEAYSDKNMPYAERPRFVSTASSASTAASSVSSISPSIYVFPTHLRCADPHLSTPDEMSHNRDYNLMKFIYAGYSMTAKK